MPHNQNKHIKKEYAGETPGHVIKAKYFYFETASRTNPNFEILCGGHEKCAPDFNINRQNFPFFGIIFTISGKGMFETDNMQHNLYPGRISALCPYVPYKLIADKQTPMEQIFILFNGNNTEILLKKSTLNTKGTVNVKNAESTLSILKNIIEIGMSQTDFAQEICCSYLKGILLEQANSTDIQPIESSSYESFQKCKNYIDNNFTNITSAQEIADQCCLNIRYIARLFRTYEKIRPYDYLTRLKVNKAANVLLTTNLNINQIARMTGFDNPYHFSRVFKSKFKISPLKYRKKAENII